MATPNFKELLKKPLDTVKRPPALPDGTYYGVVKSYEFGESSNKKTPFVRFHFLAMYGGEDIEASLLEGIDLSKRDLKKDFYITEDALYRLKEFLAALGHEVDGHNIEDLLPLTPNARVMMAITQRRTEGKEDIYNDVGEVTAQT